MGGGDWFVILISLALVALVLWLYFKFFKVYKVKNIVFIDGALGTGKSYYSVALAVRLYKRNYRRYCILSWIQKCLSWWKWLNAKIGTLEEPILYSNIRLRNIRFTKVTKDLLFRQNYRFAYKSVLLIDEFSLMADQFCYKDREMSERLSNFFKLWRHETKGGYIIVNSQTTSDLHYSLKYVLSDYLYIHHRTKWPFVTALSVQEMCYVADKDGGNVVNARYSDVEETCKLILSLNKYYKYYDSYCYSVFTDGLPVYKCAEFNGKGSYVKDSNLVSFKAYQYLTQNLEEERKRK